MARRRKKSNLVAARARMYRELIFECAERVFAEQGFDDSTMQDIAAEAGISLKTLYASFPGKNEINREIHEVRGGDLMARITAELDQGGSPLERLHRAVRAFVDFLLARPDFFRILLREGHAWGLGAVVDVEGRWQAGRSRFAELLRQGMELGQFHEGDADLMAATGIAVMQVQLAGLIRQPGEPDAQQISREIELQLQRIFCKPEQGTDKGATIAA